MNIKNRTIFTGDNLGIMRGIETESVDMIYLDPPFNSNHDYSAPIGSKAAGAEFKDTWTLSDIDLAWWGEIGEKNIGLYEVLKSSGIIRGGGAKNSSVKSYLIYMAIRLLEMHRILKKTGSLWLHCDPIMSHYLKCVLDSIFNRNNFRNEVIWKSSLGPKGSQHKTKKLGREHDVILYYAKDVDIIKFNPPKKKFTAEELNEKFPNKDKDGRWKDDSAHVFSTPNMGARPNLCYTWRGITNPHASGWRLSKERLEEEYQKENIVIKENGKILRKARLIDYKGENLGDLWADIKPAYGKERVGYPTQKPLALLERIIESSSEVGDFILDPFCGCATACLASEKLRRKWIGIDVSSKAHDLIRSRLKTESGLHLYDNLKKEWEVIHRTDIPIRKGSRSKNIKHTLYGKQEGLCNGCKNYYNFKDFEVDHVMPTAKGGINDDFNLQLLCGNCNRIKGKRLDMDELSVALRERGILSK